VDDPDSQILLGGRAAWIALAAHRDPRGQLVALDEGLLPFVPRRIFFVRDVPVGGMRGGHGHRSARQLLVCLAGRIRCELRHGGVGETLPLEPSGYGLLVEPGVWTEQTYETPGAVLLVLASAPRDPGDLFHDPADPGPQAG
jgi:hypothetical protein